MAHFHIRTYVLERQEALIAGIKFIETCVTDSNKIYLSSGGRIIDYVYDGIFLRPFSGISSGLLRSIDLNLILNFAWESLVIETRKTLPGNLLVLKQVEVLDWPKMITDLERAGKVKTFETRTLMANDPRKFYFVDASLEDAVDVDFLGTSFSKEYDDRVIEEWEENA